MKPWIFLFCLALPLLVSFVNSHSHNPHPYTLLYDTLTLEKPYLPANNPLTIEGIQLGRLLFYDPILSGNNQQSCGSCHQQQYAFTDGQRLAIGAKGDTLSRNSIALMNLAWDKEYFWDGREKSLEKAVRIPITYPTEMGQDTIELIKELQQHAHYPHLFEQAFGTSAISMDKTAKALAQFLRTIVTNGVHLPDSLLAQPPEGQTEQEFVMQQLHKPTLRGLYFRLADRCSGCHQDRLYAGTFMGNNKTTPKGTKMKIPPLINTAYTAPYMHDGRFATIRDVMKHYQKHIDEFATVNDFQSLSPKYRESLDPQSGKSVIQLSNYDVENVEKLLHILSDTTIITNKAYSNPFNQPNFDWTKFYNIP
ncbi:MAG: hypothetical protein JNM36_17070 [Chitinophagales bacterium]|nr:hypothetical protein [Chitinophagales bacterium]HNI43084.1 cytochrome c peroxidase [Chitinophagales bacterium]HNL06022.1 cytochrome c peroxidase [Chitinophagales bacterium]